MKRKLSDILLPENANCGWPIEIKGLFIPTQENIEQAEKNLKRLEKRKNTYYYREVKRKIKRKK